MSAKDLAMLQMRACLTAMEAINEGLQDITDDNITEKLSEITKRAKSDLKAIERIREITELADLPNKYE